MLLGHVCVCVCVNDVYLICLCSELSLSLYCDDTHWWQFICLSWSGLAAKGLTDEFWSSGAAQGHQNLKTRWELVWTLSRPLTSTQPLAVSDLSSVVAARDVVRQPRCWGLIASSSSSLYSCHPQFLSVLADSVSRVHLDQVISDVEVTVSNTCTHVTELNSNITTLDCK